MRLAADPGEREAAIAAAPLVSPAGKALPIAVRRLSKAYGAVSVLDVVDLDGRPGEVLTLLGRWGSG